MNSSCSRIFRSISSFLRLASNSSRDSDRLRELLEERLELDRELELLFLELEDPLDLEELLGLELVEPLDLELELNEDDSLEDISSSSRLYSLILCCLASSSCLLLAALLLADESFISLLSPPLKLVSSSSSSYLLEDDDLVDKTDASLLLRSSCSRFSNSSRSLFSLASLSALS